MSGRHTHVLFLIAECPGTDAEVERRGLAALPRDEDVMYLDGLQVHLAGCGREETLELIRICRDGAATRHAKLSSTVTHILVRPVPLMLSAVIFYMMAAVH